MLDWVCFYVVKEYGGEEGEVVWSHRPKKTMETQLIQGKVDCKREGAGLQRPGSRI